MPRPSTRADLALPPARGFLILTCMDARLDPAKYAGLAEGDAHVVRNAGGRATDDAIRSLVISHKLLGTAEWFVIHHTDCGMLFFDDALMGDLLAGSLETAELTPEGFRNRAEPGGSTEGRFVKWHTIADQEESVVEDVTRIRRPPAGQPRDPGLRLRLRRQDRPPERGRPRHRGRPPRRLTATQPRSTEDRSLPRAGVGAHESRQRRQSRCVRAAERRPRRGGAPKGLSPLADPSGSSPPSSTRNPSGWALATAS